MIFDSIANVNKTLHIVKVYLHLPTRRILHTSNIPHRMFDNLFSLWGTACTFVGNVRMVPRKKRVPRALLLGKCSRYLYATGWEVGKFSWKVLGGVEIVRGEEVQEKFF